MDEPGRDGHHEPYRADYRQAMHLLLAQSEAHDTQLDFSWHSIHGNSSPCRLQS